MSVITENDIRKMLAKNELKEKSELRISKEQLITPSAKAYLHEKNITLYIEDLQRGESHMMEGTNSDKGSNGIESVKSGSEFTYDTLFGARLNEKPEHMTHLRGNLLVFKDNPKIILRGAIDSLESHIILLQVIADREKKKKLKEDLQEIINLIRRLLRCEISGESVGNLKIQELNADEIREQSYHPSKYFGISHFLPTSEHGEIMAYLNRLRTQTREVELTAYRAFKDEYGQVSREDIIQAFNRLSSVFWIMMFRYLNGYYNG